MANPDCFGREYYDEGGEECPHHDCLLRYECKQVYATAQGILRPSGSLPPPLEARGKGRFVVQKSVPKKRGGYVKPGRLLYKDEGTLRDKLVFEIREYLEDFGYNTRSTKCLHSFVGSDKKFLLKADTRRKNSLLLYVPDGLSDHLSERGFRCRSLYDSEKPNFPRYLSWVVTLRGEGDVERFKGAFESFLGVPCDKK